MGPDDLAWSISCLFIGLYSGHLMWRTVTNDSVKKERRKLIERAGDYTEYESAKAIADAWYDQKLAGVCRTCGGDDAPLIHTAIEGNERCKWCAEFENITYHLRYNGTRRFLPKEERTAVPVFPSFELTAADVAARRSYILEGE